MSSSSWTITLLNSMQTKMWFKPETLWSQISTEATTQWKLMTVFHIVPVLWETPKKKCTYLSLFRVCTVLRNESAVEALSLISYEQFSVWQPQAVELPWKMCVIQELQEVCNFLGSKYLVLSLLPAGGQGAVGGQCTVCVGLTWGRSLGEGLGDDGGRVTWPAVKQL